MSTTLTVCSDPADLAARAADLIEQEARESTARQGRFTLALSGGSTPAKTYDLLARPERAGRIDWRRALLFQSDERFVPPEDERSNLGLAQRTLLSKVPIPPGNVFAVPTWRPTPADAAAAYACTVAWAFGSVLPSFDLILLGLGDDGHTASLFPGQPSLEVRDALVVASPPGTLPPPVDRVTFTFPLLNAARHVVFLVAGAGKAVPLRDVLEGGARVQERPAAGVRPAQGKLTWLVDREAAKLLKGGGEREA